MENQMIRTWKVALICAAMGSFAHGAWPPPARAQEARSNNLAEIQDELVEEQARQDALVALQYQLSGPFMDFTQAYDATIAERHKTAVELVREIVNPSSCNIDVLDQTLVMPDEFVTSQALNAGRDELNSLLVSIVDSGKLGTFTLSSAMPPSVTQAVVQQMKIAVEQIGPLNEQYGLACAEQERVAQLPISQASEMLSASSKVQQKQAEIAGKVETILAEMNRRIDEIDRGLVNWLELPLREAQGRS
jgi:hypothetical protein